MWSIVVAALISAPPGGALSSDAIARRAAETSPAARASLMSARAAAVRVRQTDQRFWPRVGVSARYTRLSESDPTALSIGVATVEIPAPVPDQLAVGLQVALPLSDWLTRWDAAQVASAHAVEVEEALAEVARRKAAADALVLMWQARRARLGIAVAEAGLKDAEAHRAAAEVLVKADVGSVADVRLAEAGVAAALLEVERARHAETLALSALRVVVHAGVDGDVDVHGGVDVDGGGEREVVAGVRPELVALAAGEAALRAEGRVIDAGRLPRLDVVANAQLASPSPRGLGYDDALVGLWDASLVASWSLNGLWESDASEDELAARQAKLSADRQALEDGIALEVAAAQHALSDARSAGRASAAMLTAAEEGYRVRLAAYRAGKASSIELSEAEALLSRARLGTVDATIARRIAEVKLAHARGAALY